MVLVPSHLLLYSDVTSTLRNERALRERDKVNTAPIINTKFVGLLKPDTTLSAIDDDDQVVKGNVEAYRFAQHTHTDKSTSYEIEYRVRWDDGIYEWIPWEEVDRYNPQRVRTSYHTADIREFQRHRMSA